MRAKTFTTTSLQIQILILLSALRQKVCNKITMNKQTIKTENIHIEHTHTSPEHTTINPRKAATKAKEINSHVETMKRRLQALQVQEEYNRYKTLDQEKRINLHNEIHQKIVKDRQLLRKSLQKGKDISEVKEKADKIRLQIREKLREARKSVVQQKTERTHFITQESSKHQNLIKEFKEKDWQENKQQRMVIQFQEQKKRESVSKHFVDKLKTIRVNRSMDSSALSRKAEQSEQELSRLMAYEQQLIKKNSESLQASQVMRHKFNSVFTTVSTENSSRLFPQIKGRISASTHKQIIIT